MQVTGPRDNYTPPILSRRYTKQQRDWKEFDLQFLWGLCL